VRTRGLALAALLPLAAALTAACGTTAPSAGGAYGTTAAASTNPTPASASASASASAKASGATMNTAKTTLTVRKTGIGYVLATGAGMTVYWYSDDVRNSGQSSCTAGCLTAWPAVTGTPVAAAGVKLTDKLGTITRPGGVIQATYNGYPLYTYGGDMSAGQTSGNGVGGVWHVITGAALSPSPASAAAASTRDKSGGGSAGAPSSPSATASTTTGGGY
jgi:predicted lipoprotein with Yx(FWY)xxD motif